MVKNMPAMLETWVRSLGWENSLAKGMATQSSIFAWEIQWTEETGGLQSMESVQCEVKRAIGSLSITPNKATGGDEIPIELFQV